MKRSIHHQQLKLKRTPFCCGGDNISTINNTEIMQINLFKPSLMKVTKGAGKPDKLPEIPFLSKNTNDVKG